MSASLPCAGKPEHESRERTAAGDDPAVERMVRPRGGRMLSTARRGSRNDAKDALVTAYANRRTIHPRASLGAWRQRIVIDPAPMRRRSLWARIEAELASPGRLEP